MVAVPGVVNVCTGPLTAVPATAVVTVCNATPLVPVNSKAAVPPSERLAMVSVGGLPMLV
ncbi:hypothetical protein D3C71_1393970 [compost metagenome]